MKADFLTGGLMLSIAAVLAAVPVQAQVAPPAPLPPGAAPTREEVQRADLTAPTQRPPRLTVEGGIERAACPLAEPRFSNITVTISGAEFANLRGLTPEDLRPAYEAYVGKTVPLAAICDIRDAAATLLRRAGYLAAVQVPPQRIEDGVVRFDVLMAKLVGVQVRGDAGRSERLIARYLAKLTEQELFNERLAERYLLLARDIPGYDVRLTLKPAGGAPGEVVGEVSVSRQAFAVDFNVQNYGSREVGRFGGTLRGEAYGLLGGDRLTLGYFATPDFEEQNVFQSAYDIRVGGEGLTLGGRFTYAWTRPSLDGPDMIRSETMVAGVEASYPFLRSQSRNIRGAFGLDITDQDVWLDDGNGRLPISRDRLRILYLRGDFDLFDRASLTDTSGFSGFEPRWRASGSVELRQGLNGLGASDDCGPFPYLRCLVATATPPSRAEGQPDASVIRFVGQFEYRPTPGVTIAFSPRAQYSSSPLFSYEEFSGGTYTIGRGYDPGTIVGDRGIGFQTEVRLGTLVPQSRDAFALQPYAFLDQAWVGNERPLAVPGPGRNDLMSFGLGLRGTYGDKARFDVALAAPLQAAGYQTERGDVRLLVSFSTSLMPWLR